MQSARGGQLERRPSASGVTPSRGGASAASEHGVAACHLRGELETETHGLPFTDWLAIALFPKINTYNKKYCRDYGCSDRCNYQDV